MLHQAHSQLGPGPLVGVGMVEQHPGIIDD
jgi:hypothetical protein